MSFNTETETLYLWHEGNADTFWSALGAPELLKEYIDAIREDCSVGDDPSIYVGDRGYPTNEMVIAFIDSDGTALAIQEQPTPEDNWGVEEIGWVNFDPGRFPDSAVSGSEAEIYVTFKNDEVF